VAGFVTTYLKLQYDHNYRHIHGEMFKAYKIITEKYDPLVSLNMNTVSTYEHLYSPKQAARQTEDRLYTQGKEVHTTIKSHMSPEKMICN